MLSIEEIKTLNPVSLDRLSSDSYKAEMEGDNADLFKGRVEELAAQPVTRNMRSPESAQAAAPAPAQSFSDDPSWSDEPQPAQPAAQPAATQPATVDESLPELIHEYQPVDKSGKPVGGKQRFTYRTQSELIEKLTKSHSAASARIRELSRDRKLSEIEEAGTTLVTSVPRPGAKSNLTMEELSQQNYLLAVRAALSEFKLRVPLYAEKYQSNANAQAMILHVKKRGDETTPESFCEAFNWCLENGVLEPVSKPAAAAPAPVEQAAATAATPAPARAAFGIASGLSSVDGEDELRMEAAPVAAANGVRITVDGKTQVMDLRTWDRMTSDSQRRILRVPSNAKAIDALYEKQVQERAARR